MLAAAEVHITGKGVANVEFKQAAAESLPFDDAVFDLVTCRIAPHHFDDAARFVQEAARVTKSAGWCWCRINCCRTTTSPPATNESLREATRSQPQPRLHRG
jgi:ubiquinone/menaquinone biosynthesis C-methylase UbiE